MQPYCTSFWKHRDDEYRYDIFLVYDFSNLQDIKQVYAFVLSKDRKRMLVVYDRGGMHILPGGGVEKGENNMDTLVREVKEETNREVDINTATPFFYQKAYKKNGKGEWEYFRTEVRYIVMVSKDLEFVSDPDGGIQEAEWIDLEDFGKYVKWGKTNEMINSELPKYIKKLNH